MVNTAEVRVPVAPPQVQPRLHGLITTVQPIPLQTHDRLGVQWAGGGACGGVISVTEDPCIDGSDSPEALEFVRGCLEGGTAGRYTLYTGVARSLIDRFGGDLATDPGGVFTHAEAPAVEQLFWSHAYSSANSVTPASSLLDALSLVEQDLAENYNGLGMIHVTPRVAVLLGDDGLVRPNGKLTTRTGTPVVIGAGYDGSTLSILGTGVPVLYRATNITSISVTDRSANDELLLYQRTWLIGYDCWASVATYTPPDPDPNPDPDPEPIP